MKTSSRAVVLVVLFALVPLIQWLLKREQWSNSMVIEFVVSISRRDFRQRCSGSRLFSYSVVIHWLYYSRFFHAFFNLKLFLYIAPSPSRHSRICFLDARTCGYLWEIGWGLVKFERFQGFAFTCSFKFGSPLRRISSSSSCPP